MYLADAWGIKIDKNDYKVDKHINENKLKEILDITFENNNLEKTKMGAFLRPFSN